MKALFYIFMFAACSCTAQTTEKISVDMEPKNLKVQKSDVEWKESLTPMQYHVLRQSGTERPHTGEYNLHFEDGVYKCAGCGAKLFSSESKFESHCGWPSFDKALSDSTVREIMDYSHGMTRVEIRCASCDGHLGHVFNDGPTATGVRYCINSAALGFDKKEEETKED
jgi:peptide-methionine (R)-S-oxide reductase